jgi:HAD superfamily hydrolase (TIGR01549 family)
VIEAVIFDLDGTLVNIPIDYEGLYRKIEKSAKTEKIKVLTKTLQTLSKDECIKAFEIWTNEEIQAFPNTTINEKGMKLFKVYSDKPLALVTMQSRKTVDMILGKFELKFEAVVTREDSLDRKKQIKLAIEKLKAHPRKVLMIGDRESDSAAAQDAGCRFLRV